MAFVYWFSDALGTGISTAADGTPVATSIIRWIRNNGSPALIVYGGDVYLNGSAADFAVMYGQLDNDVTLMCAPTGNHEYEGDPTPEPALRSCASYDSFWSAHPESAQPIDMTKSAARGTSISSTSAAGG